MNIRTAPIIETPRLRLIRITDTALDSDHLKWFHECWSDPVATQWSLHGACATLEESQAWFTEHKNTFDAITYIIFTKTDDQGEELPYPGKVVGNMGLRTQASGPDLPPFPHPTPSEASKPLNLRSLGYSFLSSAWGKGYATEAGRAVLDAYREGTREARKKGEEVYYLEAICSPDNPASMRVLEKLGFEEVGFNPQERAWLAGGWRVGYNVCGLYL